MKPIPLFNLSLVIAALACWATPLHALTPNAWRHRQSIEVPTGGLVRADLSPETLDAARSGLEDLRVLDSAGNEVPFLIERPEPRPGATLSPKTFQYTSDLEKQTTTLFIETGVTELLVGVSLETPAHSFLKPVRVEGSNDGQTWSEIKVGQAIFKQPDGAENQRIALDKAVCQFLRLTLDDRRSAPVPFTGAWLHTPGVPAPSKAVAVTIKSRDESPGRTRLALDLGAANLPLASLRIETPEPLFTRDVTFAVPEVSEEGICERTLGHAVIFRVGIDGKSEARLELPLERQIRSRELILIIRNDDSPPLAITGVSGEQRLTRLVFFAREPGVYLMLTGNGQCPAPRYDLAALAPQLQKESRPDSAPLLIPSRLADNPDFQAPEALGALAPAGAAIDVAGWKFRKQVQSPASEVQQLELDLETLAHAARNGSDLRLVRAGQQIPFLLDRPSISRTLALNVASVVVPKRPTLSRWSLKLPQAGLPITRLGCGSPSPLFQREMRLWEERTTPHGEKYPRELGCATWRQTPGTPPRELAIELAQSPQTDTLFLETDNGDNPAMELRDFRCYYPVTRMVFKAARDPAQPLWLYYGNREASTPRYDLSLISAQLLRAEKSAATAGAEEPTKAAPTTKGEQATEPGGILFWCVLAGVVVALLVIVSRLLPKGEEKG